MRKKFIVLLTLLVTVLSGTTAFAAESSVDTSTAQVSAIDASTIDTSVVETSEQTSTNIVSDALMIAYFQCNWADKDMDYKKNLNGQLAMQVASYLGIETPGIVYYSEPKDENGAITQGRYTVGKSYISINETTLSSAKATYETIIHEVRHVWQYKRSQLLTTDADYAYKMNFDNYTTYKKSFSEYTSQTIEVDANNLASIAYSQLLTLAKQPQYQYMIALYYLS